jgi:misacylated tRNA(Ala) deacylase
MTTQEPFSDDAYATECATTVERVNDQGGTVLAATVFYPSGGGQPGDRGTLQLEERAPIRIATTVTDRDTGEIVHAPEEGQDLPPAGTVVTAQIDWNRAIV